MFQEQQAQVARDAEKAVRLQAMTQAFEKTTDVTLEHLPSLMLPAEPAAVTQLAQLHQVLEQWAALVDPTPFTLSDLIAHSPLAQDAPEFMRTALGDKWASWFPGETPDDAVVPKQVALLLLASLKRLSETWVQSNSQEATRLQAAGSYTALTSAAKKRRAALLDSEMIPVAAPPAPAAAQASTAS